MVSCQWTNHLIDFMLAKHVGMYDGTPRFFYLLLFTRVILYLKQSTLLFYLFHKIGRIEVPTINQEVGLFQAVSTSNLLLPTNGSHKAQEHTSTLVTARDSLRYPLSAVSWLPRCVVCILVGSTCYPWIDRAVNKERSRTGENIAGIYFWSLHTIYNPLIVEYG